MSDLDGPYRNPFEYQPPQQLPDIRDIGRSAADWSQQPDSASEPWGGDYPSANRYTAPDGRGHNLQPEPEPKPVPEPKAELQPPEPSPPPQPSITEPKVTPQSPATVSPPTPPASTAEPSPAEQANPEQTDDIQPASHEQPKQADTEGDEGQEPISAEQDESDDTGDDLDELEPSSDVAGGGMKPFTSDWPAITGGYPVSVLMPLEPIDTLGTEPTPAEAALVNRLERGINLGHRFSETLVGIKAHLRPDRPEIEPPTAAEIETAQKMETERYVTNAPKITDIKDDTSRTQLIYYLHGPGHVDSAQQAVVGGDVHTITEHDALVELDTVLVNLINEFGGLEADHEHAWLGKIAEGVRDNLHFIGEKELLEATAGIAANWKAYLHEDPNRQICVPLRLVRVSIGAARVKSDERIFGTVMSHFTPDELAAYGPQIVTNINQLQPNADNTRLILLDDWWKSGGQMSSAVSEMIRRGVPAKYFHRMRMQVVVASPRQIEETARLNGFPVHTQAYYRTADNTGRYHRPSPLVTGAHSAVDIGFGDTLHELVWGYNDIHPDRPMYMPALVNVKRRHELYRRR